MTKITSMFRKNDTPFAKLEADLADRRKRHAGLGDKLSAARAVSDRADEERRRLLVEVDDAPADQIAAAELACREAAGRVATLEDALRAVSAQVTDAEQALAADREKVAREIAATETERRAVAIDVAAGKLAETLKVIAMNYEQLRTAIDGGGIADAGHAFHSNHSAETYALSVLLGGIEGVMPGAASKILTVGIVVGETADTAARRLQSSRLRAHAEDLRAGSAAIGTLPTPHEAAYRPAAMNQYEKTRIVLCEPILFRDERSAPTRCIAGEVELPMVVAARAIDLGIGHQPGSVEGVRLSALMKAKPGAAASGTWLDVGINLAEGAR